MAVFNQNFGVIWRIYKKTPPFFGGVKRKIQAFSIINKEILPKLIYGILKLPNVSLFIEIYTSSILL